MPISQIAAYDWAEPTLKKCKPALQALWARIKAEGIGVGLWSTLRPGDHYPDHRSGLGMDLGVARQPGTKGNKALGDKMAAQLIQWHRQGLIQLRSIIWWRRRWTPNRGWHPYTGSNPHVCHVHVWLGNKSPCISPTPGRIHAVKTTKPGRIPKYPLGVKAGHRAHYGPKTGPVWQRSGYYSEEDRTNVRRIQARLRQFGHEIAVDGLYGPETQKAVTAYQTRTGLLADGLVGPRTWWKLFRETR